MSLRASLDRALAALRRARRALHVVVGAPDYDRYLEHHRLHHAGAPLSRVEYERGWMERRARPGARCC
jgi:uncharacterized short protein YbdD (DUF466 family)